MIRRKGFAPQPSCPQLTRSQSKILKVCFRTVVFESGLGDRVIGMQCPVIDLHGWRLGAGNDRTRLSFSVFGFSLNLGNGRDIISRKVRLVIALSPMRLFRIRTAQPCFRHVITSSAVFPERRNGYLNYYSRTKMYVWIALASRSAGQHSTSHSPA